jgi:hypothetical protein
LSPNFILGTSAHPRAMFPSAVPRSVDSGSVSDPHSFNPDPDTDPALNLNTDLDPGSRPCQIYIKNNF